MDRWYEVEYILLEIHIQEGIGTLMKLWHQSHFQSSIAPSYLVFQESSSRFYRAQAPNLTSC